MRNDQPGYYVIVATQKEPGHPMAKSEEIKEFEKLVWPTMADLVQRLYATDDAKIWAEEFMRVVNSGATVDEGLMVGWFANAMVTAVDHAKKREKQVGDTRIMCPVCWEPLATHTDFQITRCQDKLNIQKEDTI